MTRLEANLKTEPGLLKNPTAVRRQEWSTGITPLVTIICPTYNHVKFIEKAIEGFLMQETKFPVEILINDDASTDGTAGIVKKYADNYPNLIYATLQTENQYSKGNLCIPTLIAQARGEYVALCEGDDYWISKDKLSIQHDILSSTPEVVIVGHEANVLDDNLGTISEHTSLSAEMLQNGKDRVRISGRELIYGTTLLTLSVFFRRIDVFNGKSRWRKITHLDTYLFAMFGVHGDAIYLSEPMAVYRVHQGGVWSSASELTKLQDMLKSRIAIAHDIEYNSCIYACHHLSEMSLFLLSKAIKQHTPIDWRLHLKAYFSGLLLSFRAYLDSFDTWPTVMSYQIKILFLPFRSTYRFVYKKVSNLFHTTPVG